MRVLLTGAGGQLARDLAEVYADHDLIARSHAELDLGDEAAIEQSMREVQPELVLNAGAWTDVDGCERDEDRAHRVNALGPWWLARGCARSGATLVQISTDYVFPGQAPLGPGGEPRGWSEFDPVAPLNAYGRSKAASEALVRETLREHHLIRTAWVNGAGGRNFVSAMLKLGAEHGRVRVVTDQVGSPTFTRDLAAAIREVTDAGRYGTLHRTNTGSCSWFELATAVFELSGMDVEVAPTTSAEFARPAPRPAWSVLDDRHARTQGLSALPHWRDGLARMLAELAPKG